MRFFNPAKSQIAEALVDGTSHFLGAAALVRGFEELRRRGGAAAVAAHAAVLAEELQARLAALRHADGAAAIEVYGAGWARGMDKSTYRNSSTGMTGGANKGKNKDTADHGHGGACGPTVAFNVLRHDGSYVGYAEVGKLAALNLPPIQLRTGCCCNPGGCQALVGMSEADVLSAVATGKQCGDHVDLIDGRPTGLVSASPEKDSASFVKRLSFVCKKTRPRLEKTQHGRL
jgi:molybdenum cofactor sulfurtransferase